MHPRESPKSPESPAIINIANLYKRKAFDKSRLGITNPEIMQIAIIITVAGETIFASTAAWPTIKPPTIDDVCPIT